MNKISRTIRRRRREGKTDYRARMALLKSNSPRLVVRRTNRYLIAQIIQSDIAQDKLIVGVSSKDLISYGWPKDKAGSLKNLSASYLTGYLLAKKATKVKKAILDIGLQRNMKGGRLYAVLKGAIEGGLEIPSDESAIPNDDRFNKQDSDLLNKVKEKINNG